MKIHQYIPAAIAASALAITSASCTKAEAGTEEQLSSPYTLYYSPEIPPQVELCGEMISLDREDMYERYDRELTSMAFGHGNTLAIIKRANRYFPEMSRILAEEGVPQDMLYLACIESSLIPIARSGAGAQGLWQFMPTTAREYGLEVNDSVDQRLDTELATRAACRFLKNAYNKYGSWESVAASYNAGMGRISRELAAQGVDTAFDLFLVEETSRYIYRLMAMKAIMDNPAAYGFIIRPDQLYYPAEYDIVEVNAPVKDWIAWAREHGISYKELRDHNPWIRGKSLPAPKAARGKAAPAPKTYKVRVPSRSSLSRSASKPEPFNPKWITQ